MSYDPETADNELTIEELVVAGYIEEESKEHGVARQWANTGYDSLTSKQRVVFDNSLGKLMEGAECSVCDGPIPFNELPLYLAEGDRLCSYHRHQAMKDD